jgi:hypothetical protein
LDTPGSLRGQIAIYYLLEHLEPINRHDRRIYFALLV